MRIRVGTVLSLVGSVVLALAAACAHPVTSGSTTGTTPVPGTSSATLTPTPGVPYVVAPTPEAAGEYLTIVGGCGDCHTAMGATSAEAKLAGNPVGYRGDWGTSYAPNLRMLTQRLPEDRWVAILKAGHGDPPMPWANIKQMNEQDLRAMYRYVRALGPAGTRMPRMLKPGQEPTTPYIDMRAKQPG